MDAALESQAWALALAQACPFGDQRHGQRVAKMLADFAARPGASIPMACGHGAGAKGAYEFLKNGDVEVEAMVEGFGVAAAQACRGRALALAVSDTTTINWSGLSVPELGPLNDAPNTKGVHLHSVLALDPAGYCLGVLDQQTWVRPPRAAKDANGAKAAPPAADRPFEEKESAKWTNGMDAARRRLHETLEHEVPEILHVMDREGDVWEVLQTIDDWGERAVIRATQDRRTSDPEGRAYAAVRSQAPLAVAPLDLPASPSRAARVAAVEVRTLEVELTPDPRRHPAGWPMTWTLVEIVEPEPPEGVAPLHWRLWTREPAATLADVLLILQWYLFRWRIEDYHFTLKTGCGIERLKLATFFGLLKALAMYAALAARVLGLRDRARVEPEAPASVLLSADEEQALHLQRWRRPRPADAAPMTLREATLWIARMGGHLNRKGDGMPGVKTLWQGLSELSRLAEGYRLGRMFPDRSG